jgi:hypothetical protein
MRCLSIYNIYRDEGYFYVQIISFANFSIYYEAHSPPTPPQRRYIWLWSRVSLWKKKRFHRKAVQSYITPLRWGGWTMCFVIYAKVRKRYYLNIKVSFISINIIYWDLRTLDVIFIRFASCFHCILLLTFKISSMEAGLEDAIYFNMNDKLL